MSTVHVVLLSLCLAAVPPAALARPAGSAIEQAMGAYERGDLETAQRMFEALSRSGLPAADYNLAVMALDAGQPALAEGHMRRAAAAGFVTAMLGLGRLHETGWLGRVDLPAATHWYRLAAEGGSVEAMVETGTAHYLGRGAALDRAQAAHWYREAAKGGDIGAQYLIASMYETGDGVQQDLRLARYWYTIAAQNGDEAAPGKLKEVDAKLLGPEAAASLPATAPP
ncbi:MAG: sel1 repeat family protein [Rubrivivax sp.]|nr:sel1 repeat family protein [Rubrivivax sp.]